MIPYVVAEYPNVVFLVVGDGPLRGELEDMTRALKVEQNVIFTGFRTDVEDIVKQVTFGVYPVALSAGMVSVITSGKVLISRKGSAMDEYIEHNHTGILVDSDDPRDYAHATVQLLRNGFLLESMESNVREMLPSKFDGQKNIEIFENLVRDVVVTINSKKDG
jgi:glycosyltransferase involved in cell wall biosynthesis